MEKETMKNCNVLECSWIFPRDRISRSSEGHIGQRTRENGARFRGSKIWKRFPSKDESFIPYRIILVVLPSRSYPWGKQYTSSRAEHCCTTPLMQTPTLRELINWAGHRITHLSGNDRRSDFLCTVFLEKQNRNRHEQNREEKRGKDFIFYKTKHSFSSLLWPYTCKCII